MKLNYKEYKHLHQDLLNNGYNSDELSRDIIAQFLEAQGCTNIHFTVGNDSTDIIATQPNGEKTAFEIKDRSFNSTKYNDHMIENIKYNSLLKRKQKGEFQHIYLISMFDDSIIFITKDIDKIYSTVSNKPCPVTTKLNNHKIVYKECRIFKPTNIRYIQIEIEDRKETYHISDKPFNQYSTQPLF